MTFEVRWIDVSQGYHFRCAKTYSTRADAEAKLAEFAERRRRYYSGVMAPYCPFINERLVVA